MEGEREEKTPGFAIWYTREGEKEERKKKRKNRPNPETLSLSLGREDPVEVLRKRDRDFRKQQFLQKDRSLGRCEEQNQNSNENNP